MKKLLFFGLLISLLFSCGEKTTYSVSFTNDSSKEAAYTYNDVSDTLPANETKVYEVGPYTQAPTNISDVNGIASIVMKQDHLTGNFTFYNVDCYKLTVKNEWFHKITIRADNYVDFNNNGEQFLTVEAEGEIEESAGVKVYTSSPKFTLTPSYPYDPVLEIVGDVMSLTIK